MNATQKYFLLFMLGVAALVALVFYLAFVIPDVGKYVYIAVLAIAGAYVLYISFLPLVSFLSERAGAILNVYLDETGSGIHIFSTYSVSRYKTFRSPLRYIQHYFIVTETGKLYYKVLFSHAQRPVAGEVGYPGYTSFETDILGSADLTRSIEEFSKKTNMSLRLGKHIGKSDEDHYSFQTGNARIEIKKFRGTLEDVFEVLCYTADCGKLNWKRKI